MATALIARKGKMSLARQAAYDFATFYERRESDRWALADICAVVSENPGELVRLADELENNFGIKVTATSLGNYARVANAFSKENRHLQYKWSNYLEWSKHPDPIKAMELALDNGYSPTQMSRLRRHGDPEYREEKPPSCTICGGELEHCSHGETTMTANPDARWLTEDEVAEIVPGVKEMLRIVDKEIEEGRAIESDVSIGMGIDLESGNVAEAVIYPGPIYEKLWQSPLAERRDLAVTSGLIKSSRR